MNAADSARAKPLDGRTVAFLEARRSAEVARLVEMQGGTPMVAPALREVPLDDPAPLDAWLGTLTRGEMDVVLFLTGVGCGLLLERAKQSGSYDAVLHALEQARVVARGPKPVRVLKEHNIRVDFVPPEPNTSEELLAAFASWSLSGKTLGLQLYGGSTPFLERLRSGLTELGAKIVDVMPYRWEGPTTHTGVLDLIDACAGGRVDALAIFSSSQIHTLFAIAEEHDRATALHDALNKKELLVASVGPVATDAIRSHDVPVDVEPEHPKMGHLIMALAAAYGAPSASKE
jgi:uroporphyrinogen-III synthase